MTNNESDSERLPPLELALQQLDNLDSDAIELFVPRRLTLQGQPAGSQVIEALMTDRLLRQGFWPVESERIAGGKQIVFHRDAPANSGPWKTELPPIDITQVVPSLRAHAATTIRLHPRRAVVSDPAASKLGGTFLWPRSEPWPRCDDNRHQTGVHGRPSATNGISPTLVGLIQLNAQDFPSIRFRPGADLLQLLWCPTSEEVHDDDFLFPKLFAYWRSSVAVTDPITEHPLPDCTETYLNYFPVSCRISPEAVKEYPTLATIEELRDGSQIHDLLAADDTIWEQYQNDLCACPSTKLGGYPNWIQNEETPTCRCGKKMDFLVQFCDWEYTNMNTSQRWIPLADRWAVEACDSDPAAEAILRPHLLDFAHVVFYVFVCRRCPEWPVRLVDQR